MAGFAPSRPSGALGYDRMAPLFWASLAHDRARTLPPLGRSRRWRILVGGDEGSGKKDWPALPTGELVRNAR
jgi:hypothetical protein